MRITVYDVRLMTIRSARKGVEATRAADDGSDA
jgi:hypothetical protein